jgi:hypothetical protein
MRLVALLVLSVLAVGLFIGIAIGVDSWGSPSAGLEGTWMLKYYGEPGKLRMPYPWSEITLTLSACATAEQKIGDINGYEVESPVREFTTAEEIVEHDLTIFSTAGGTVIEPGEGTFTYNEGTVVDLSVAVEESSRFVNWTGDVDTVADVNAPTTTITMDDDYSITANFKERTNWLKIGVVIVVAVLVVGLASFFFLRRRKKAA